MKTEIEITESATVILRIAGDGELAESSKIKNIETHLRTMALPTFFAQLAETLDHDVDLNFTIRKNGDGTLTISIMPVVQKGSAPKKSWKPVVGTTTPETLDKEFFTKLNDAVKASAEMIHTNAESVKKEAAKKDGKKAKAEPEAKTDIHHEADLKEMLLDDQDEKPDEEEKEVEQTTLFNPDDF